ncbi:MAG: hypothetical protein II599_07575 [Bacteroidales bacterium]|nr:hypothetical protein [Bacteroidales bacterium]MBQ4169674.1 hypothetical protein [Bacteroidales bacterium]
MNASVKSVLLDSISIILGVFITFWIQDLIDQSHDREEVRSALWLVRTELTNNLEDINILNEYLNQENASAKYFLRHRNDIDSCPADSIAYHSGMILAAVNATVSNDALEFLQSSSLFPKIGNSLLSMKIIRAYDSSQLTVDIANKHIEDRNERFEDFINENNVNQIASQGAINIPAFIKTDYGLYSMMWITNQVVTDQTGDISDIKEALTAIDDYLRRH